MISMCHINISHALGTQWLNGLRRFRGHSIGRVPSDASAVAGANEVDEGTSDGWTVTI